MPTFRRKLAHINLIRLMLLACSLVAAVPAEPVAQASAQSPAYSFASPDFEEAWQRSDGPVAGGQVARSWLWGPAPGVSLSEPFKGAQDGSRLVQYFDKARMELNTAVTDTASIWRVTTGLLVSEMVQGRMQTGPESFTQVTPSQQVLAGDSASSNNPRYSDFGVVTSIRASDRSGAIVRETMPGRGRLTTQPPDGVSIAKYIPETSHNIADVFWSYFQQPDAASESAGTAVPPPLFDWLYVMGYPISEPVWCSLTIDGKPEVALIQLFQRRVLTYVPSFPAGWQVQMGNTGQHYYEWRYQAVNSGTQQGQDTTGSNLPQLPAATGGFVGIAGDSFVYNGSPIKLKGSNYWASQAPFVGTWSEWNGPQVVKELEKAHELRINAVRVGLPYNHRDTMDIIWGGKKMGNTNPRIINIMRQFLQIAASYNMKVIFVLFEWYDNYPPQYTADEKLNLTYVQGIVGPFVNDDRVLAWDLHNEPDFYDGWKRGQQDEVIDWLHRMALAIRQMDNHHPITVGVGNYSDLWYPASNGLTISSFLDFVAFHCYDTGSLASQVAAIKAHTAKPILLEEMGWPTALGGEAPVPNAVYDESTQTYLYTSMLKDAKASDIAGVFQWTLWDYWGGQTNLIPGHERYFGLVRQDGTFKPAAAIFKDNYLARDLPSLSQTNVPLDTSDRPNPRP